MLLSRPTRLIATVSGVGALCFGLLTACSDDSGDAGPASSEPVATTTAGSTEAVSGTGTCEQDAPTGPAKAPASTTDYETGDAAYTVSLSDGTEKCVVVQSDSNSGEFTSDKEIDIRFGDTSAGFLVTVDGENSGNLSSDVPHQVRDAFMGLQIDGAYFADSMHIGCEVTITGLNAEMIAGEFTCTDVALFAGGPFSLNSDAPAPPPTDLSLDSAQGWFVVRA